MKRISRFVTVGYLFRSATASNNCYGMTNILQAWTIRGPRTTITSSGLKKNS